MPPRPLRLTALLLALTAVIAGLLAAAPAGARPAALPEPAGAALDWIEGELAADGGNIKTAFADETGAVSTFDDWGLTIDAVLALAAAGRGGGAAATTADGLVEDNVAAYVTGGELAPNDRYAGALAKALLLAGVQGEDPTDFGGLDLVAELLGRLQADGRFTDQSEFGDFSNGFGQALAILGLARTPAGPPASAVDFLLAQQCPGGGFRGDYTAPGGCTADADATVDATGFALQALLVVEPTCPVRQAVQDGVASLVAGQNPGGAFGGESGSNANSTGLAAVALRSLGVDPAASNATAFVTGLQLQDGDDIGAVALNQAGFDAAGDGVQELERDGFRRATTQGVLALGLPSYGEIGGAPVDPSTLTACTPGEGPTPTTPGTPTPGTPTEVPRTLPATGRAEGVESAAGLGLVLVGWLLVTAARRRSDAERRRHLASRR